ncbi:Smr/MutS family protein [Hydrogenovibrio sp. JE_KL2]|uniref:Smr/MutS family protein n=1 Tax=Hydrogenovibrio sp. JE_KL2 TaxID=2651188 RepID=UPI00128C6D6D|nr:Smr/MutS family protein [Hydrogenovibrio sp. JE_KL2]MPQ76046.1 hypothetical protein [Hydrogenovibrio sp. JE_KL2]
MTRNNDEMNSDEKSLFAEAMSDVTPLQLSSNKVAAEVKPRPVNAKKSMRSSTRFNATDLYNEPADKVSAHETLFFQRYSLSKSDLKALKNGSFQYNWSTDLHGLTELEAEKQLIDFLSDALLHEQKHVLIVHGKGYHSNTEQPVLKNLVNQVLRNWPHIIAFCSAKPKDGGTGATYAFLKLKKV